MHSAHFPSMKNNLGRSVTHLFTLGNHWAPSLGTRFPHGVWNSCTPTPEGIRGLGGKGTVHEVRAGEESRLTRGACQGACFHGFPCGWNPSPALLLNSLSSRPTHLPVAQKHKLELSEWSCISHFNVAPSQSSQNTSPRRPYYFPPEVTIKPSPKY